MKSLILASLLVVAVSASLLEQRVTLFESFKATHDKTYSNQVEEATRFAIFSANLAEIEEHNLLYDQGLVSYRKSINRFSDMTQEEFKSYLTLHSKPTLKSEQTIPYVKKGVEIAASVDWREQGYVTEVKDQGDCGSCWSFAVTGSTEGAYYRSSGNLVSLSEQQLIDCTTYLNFGCDGGYLDETIPYIAENGLQSESSYPYTATDGTCRYDSSQVVTKVSTYHSISDEESLLEAVATQGPVAAAIDATYITFYDSGVYSSSQCSADELNHGVLIVGYGTENGQDYWLIKNSWGSSWGDAGYFKLLRGTNECGVAVDDVYPVV